MIAFHFLMSRNWLTCYSEMFLKSGNEYFLDDSLDMRVVKARDFNRFNKTLSTLAAMF